MKIGYARVSSDDQNLARQLEEFKKYGCNKVVTEKQSGKDIEGRENLNKMIESLKPGDQVVILDVDRITRGGFTDYFAILSSITSKGASLYIISDKFDSSNFNDFEELVQAIKIWIAKTEREKIRERQRQGIEIAKAAGKYHGRPPVKRDPANLKVVFEGYINNTLKLEEAASMIMNLDNGTVGVTVPTFYRLLDKWCKENGYTRVNRYAKTEENKQEEKKQQLDEADDFLQNYKLDEEDNSAYKYLFGKN